METRCYLTVEPKFGTQNWNRDRLEEISVTNVTKKRPRGAKGVFVELVLRIPDGVFLPLRPVVTIEVPEEAAQYEAVVEVMLPEES